MGNVTISAVRKKYGNLEVIHGLDIPIDDGEFVVLVGPSGCGKSTLLRMIAGLEDISDGDIIIGDKRVNDIAPKERDVAMVFQNYALYPHMTVAQNMGFSLKLRRRPAEEISTKVRQAAEILGLDKLLDRHPRALSGGQRQRVAMGRAIVRDPEVFLFDEPLSNLDAKLRVQMRAEVKNLHQRLRTTTVYVTHDQIEAMTMADKIVVMLDGHVEQIGAPLELYDRPETRFVAGFIGSPSMNFIPGTIREGSFTTNGGTVLSLPDHARLEPEMPVVLGIRPEDMEICEEDTPETISGRITVVEPTGAETIVQVETEAGHMTALVRQRLTGQPGQSIGFTVPRAKTHYFDGASQNGRRLF